MDKPPEDIIGKEACGECLEHMENAVLDGDEYPLALPDFVRRHIDECADCRAFEKAVELLSEIPRVSEELVRRAAGDYFDRNKKRRFRLVVGLPLAASFAAAAAVLLILKLPLFSEPVSSGANLALTVLSGNPLVEGAEARAGTELAEGQEITTGVKTALAKASSKLSIGIDGHTNLALDRLRRDRVRINLKRGYMAVHLAKSSGVDLVVDAHLARIIVTGTVFSVEKLEDEVNVTVVQGAVRVESDRWPGETVEVREGHGLAVTKRERRPVSSQSERSIFSLLGMRTNDERASSMRSRGGGDEASDSSKDATGSISTEIQTDVEEAHRADSERGSGKTGANGKRAQREIEKGEPDRALSISDLIRSARACRSNRDWVCAADAYENVIDLYPDRAEAATVLVPLAQIELERLKRPSRALLHYSSYYDSLPTGPLAQEALFGRCKALSSMGWTDKELESLEEFLDKYPKSVYAPNARTRLNQLKAH
jgi:TolA-binding protein